MRLYPLAQKNACHTRTLEGCQSLTVRIETPIIYFRRKESEDVGIDIRYSALHLSDKVLREVSSEKTTAVIRAKLESLYMMISLQQDLS